MWARTQSRGDLGQVQVSTVEVHVYNFVRENSFVNDPSVILTRKTIGNIYFLFYFEDFNLLFRFSFSFSGLLVEKRGFLIPRGKTMQNYYEITSKSQFCIRNVVNRTKTLTSVMSGPAKVSPGGPGGDKSWSAGQALIFFSEKFHLSFIN